MINIWLGIRVTKWWNIVGTGQWWNQWTHAMILQRFDFSWNRTELILLPFELLTLHKAHSRALCCYLLQEGAFFFLEHVAADPSTWIYFFQHVFRPLMYWTHIHTVHTFIYKTVIMHILNSKNNSDSEVKILYFWCLKCSWFYRAQCWLGKEGSPVELF